MNPVLCTIPLQSSQKSRKEKAEPLHTMEDSPLVTVPCMMEPVPGTPVNPKIERMLSEILVKPEGIEEKIDDAVYLSESAIRPAYIKKIKKAEPELQREKEKTYASMGRFHMEYQTRSFTIIADAQVDAIFRKMWQKDSVWFGQIEKKLIEPAENPEIGKPLKTPLRGFRRLHIGHYILIYKIDRKNRKIILMD